MAGTYYKYAERQADSYVNWAEIGNNMSSMLVEENKIREDKKAYLDEQTRKNLIEISKIPEGSDVSARAAALELADNASKYLLMQEKEFKAGRLKTKDYLTGRQNTMDDIGASFDTLEAYQKVFGEKMQRGKDGISSQGEMLQMANVEGYGNWKESGFIFDPATGRVMAAKRNKDGVLDPTTAVSLNHLNSLIQGNWDKANVDADLAKLVNSFGTILKEKITKNPSYSSIGKKEQKDGILNLEGFADSETKLIQAQLTNPYYAGSVLLDYVDKDANGKDYYLAINKDDKDPAAIHQNGTEIVLTAEQNKAAEDYLRMRARTMYDDKVSVSTISQTNDPYASRTMKGMDEKDIAPWYAKNIADMLGGAKGVSSNGANSLSAETGNLISKTKDGYTITGFDDKGKPLGTANYGYEKNLVRSIIGALGVPASAKAEVEKQVNSLLGGNLNKTDFFETAAKAKKTEEVERDYTPYVNSSHTRLPEAVKWDKPQETAKKLNEIYRDLGIDFTVEKDDDGYIYDQVTATGTYKGKTVTTKINIDPSSSSTAIKDIEDFVNSNFDKKSASEMFGAQAQAEEDALAAEAAPRKK